MRLEKYIEGLLTELVQKGPAEIGRVLGVHRTQASQMKKRGLEWNPKLSSLLRLMTMNGKRLEVVDEEG